MAMHHDFMDYNNEDLATILGDTFSNTWPTAASPLYSPSFTTNFTTEPLLVSHEPPPKQRKLDNFGTFSTMSDLDRAASSFVVNFGTQTQGNWNARETTSPEVRTGQKTGRVRATQPQPYDHISAERKRREQLSQMFITLSTIVPGLKKLDKNSVLADAIAYLKQLKERVTVLEERTTKQTIESAVLIKKQETTTIMENQEQPLPEIEAKVSENTILVNILCEKHKGLVVKILAEVEKLNLVVVNTSVASFGTQAFHITILAEMEKEFNLTLKDVISAMRCAVLARA